METLVSVYKSVGEKVRTDISKRGIPQAKLAPLLAKFDEVQANQEVAEVRAGSSKEHVVAVALLYVRTYSTYAHTYAYVMYVRT